ncbi:hypothetical protein Asi03nite_52960 [Actinoplanes siamensis]|uniref:Uncharacterized protein n=1 Tax=Actinoplanes siamensis TaxID=1223317 RepID=A0A919NB97_9ACTN|nr:hypothetical protein Asi03nite_52960 [Actinoplanes siamensis]
MRLKGLSRSVIRKRLRWLACRRVRRWTLMSQGRRQFTGKVRSLPGWQVWDLVYRHGVVVVCGVGELVCGWHWQAGFWQSFA